MFNEILKAVVRSGTNHLIREKFQQQEEQPLDVFQIIVGIIGCLGIFFFLKWILFSV